MARGTGTRGRGDRGGGRRRPCGLGLSARRGTARLRFVASFPLFFRGRPWEAARLLSQVAEREGFEPLPPRGAKSLNYADLVDG